MNTLASTVFKNQLFKFSHIHTLGSKVDFDVKDHHVNNVRRSYTLMLHTNSQGKRSFGPEEEYFNCFLPYMGMVAILVM